jgi:hypothetical protein
MLAEVIILGALMLGCFWVGLEIGFQYGKHGKSRIWRGEK